MAQRKPSPAGKPAAKKGAGPTGKPRASATPRPGAKTSPARKPGKSIVNQRQTPWGLIITVVVIIIFAGGVIGVVVATHGSNKSSASAGPQASCSNPANAAWCKPELPAAKAIKGVRFHLEPNHTHITSGTVKYDTTPPTGGNHSADWADCNGTVYPQPIANENAVHPLEHGSVWVTYREGLPASQVATLAKDVQGKNHVLMSPYPDLKTKVSLQAWGYQLFVNSVTDPRINQFISTLAANPNTAPEESGGQVASCTNPGFVQNPSTFGHPNLTGTPN